MGKKSREKREAQARDKSGGFKVPGGMYVGLMFQIGLEYPRERPIMLNFSVKGQEILPTRWTIEEARIMASGLQKFCEMAEQKDREAAAAKTLPHA